MSTDDPDIESTSDVRRRAVTRRSRVALTVATYCVLSLAGAFSFVLPETIPSASVAEIPRPVHGPPSNVVAPPEIAGAIARGREPDPPAARDHR